MSCSHSVCPLSMLCSHSVCAPQHVCSHSVCAPQHVMQPLSVCPSACHAVTQHVNLSATTGMIRIDCVWSSISTDPLVDHDSGHSGSLLIGKTVCLHPPSKVISDNHNVLVTSLYGLREDVENWCRCCQDCAESKEPPSTARGPLIASQVGFPME